MAEAALTSPRKDSEEISGGTKPTKSSKKSGKSSSQKPSTSSKADETSNSMVIEELRKMRGDMEDRMSKFEQRLDDFPHDAGQFQDYQEFDYDPEDYIEPSQMPFSRSKDTSVPDQMNFVANELLKPTNETDMPSAHADETGNISGADCVIDLIKENLPLPCEDGDKINPKLAGLVKRMFDSNFDDTEVIQKMKDIKRPENCPDLNTPHVNKLIWNTLSPDTRSMDVRMQKAQNGLIKSTTSVVATLNILSTKKQEIPDDLFTQIVSNLSDSLTLSAYSNRNMNLRRKELIRPHLNEEYKAMCAPGAAVSSEFLFGDDISKSLQDISMATRLGNKVTGPITGRGRGFPSRFRRFNPYHTGFRFRSRGRGLGRAMLPLYDHYGNFLGGRGRGNWNKPTSERRGGGEEVSASDPATSNGQASPVGENSEVGNFPRRETALADQTAEPDSLPTIRKSYSDRGISAEATSVIISSWRKTTRKQYASYVRKWKLFCRERQIDFYRPHLGQVLDFFVHLMNMNLGYNSIHTARCALSTFVFLDNQPCGSHPVVCRFLKGIFQLKPPKPRYSEIWSVKSVLSFIGKLFPHKFLSLKDLSIKLVLLLSLVTAQRGQTIHLLDLSNMHHNSAKTEYTFQFDQLLKQSRPGRLPKPMTLRTYPHDKCLCVVTTLRAYIKRTMNLRGTVTKLLIAYIRPHQPVCRDTVSRWIKAGLSRSGIDVSVFKPHSVRAASTSAASKACVPVADILDKADWTSHKTFARFYQKPLIETSAHFDNAVLTQ